jgi:hypothetical protein
MAQGRKDHYEMLIGGVGTAGSTVAAQLRRKLRNYDLAIVLGRDAGQPGVAQGLRAGRFRFAGEKRHTPGQ